MGVFALTLVFTLWLCVPTFAVKPEKDAPENCSPLVMTLMEEVRTLRQEMKKGFSSVRKKIGPRKKQEELAKKMDTCTAGVELLRVQLVPTTTKTPTTTTTTTTTTTIPTTMTICEPGWLKYDERCYFFSTESSNWGDSHVWCLGKGAQLVSVNSQTEQDFLSSSIEFIAEHTVGGRTSHWIGMTYVPKKLEWLDGSDVEFTSWGQDNPNCMPSGVCRVVLSVSYEWNWEDYGRKNKARYVCEKNETLTVPYEPPTTTTLAPTTTTTTPIPTVCPPGAVPFQGHCYLFELEERTLQGALDMCRGQGFYLVSINSWAEQQFLVQTARQFSTYDAFYWIGMKYDNDRKKLIWEDGSDVTYTSWSTRKRDCLSEGWCGAFLSSYNNFKWDLVFNTSTTYYLCESTGLNS